MKACLVAIGSELLRPGFRETHSDWIIPRLEREGFEVASRVVATDDPSDIRRALEYARSLKGLVLVTGGIGPTRDDRTREALAKLLNRPLRRDPRAERLLRQWCRKHRFALTRAQRLQALLPAGAKPIRNRVGSAPGIWADSREGVVIALPGVPSEMQAMFESLVPRLRRLAHLPVATRTLRTAGVGETRIDHRIRAVAKLFPGVEVTTLGSPGEVTIQLRSRGRGAEARVERCRRWIARVLDSDLVSANGETLEAVVFRLLRERKWKLSTAESCTAGMVAARLTRVPGSSAVFHAGAVCYNDRAKERMLAVPHALLLHHGAVSRAAARAMARGAVAAFGAEMAVAVTGIAGPGGGTERKPVGTVHWAVAHPEGGRAIMRHLAGDRDKIRTHAACIALDLVRRTLLRIRPR
ncbi:MAG: CinA family nicotinamide mononucleotide deamidase-related protein [Acidobacteria bacterium]|nr:CinA family nicotinamide mononucleotide deamidase-related protein [Acidobacteriota bacterium]